MHLWVRLRDPGVNEKPKVCENNLWKYKKLMEIISENNNYLDEQNRIHCDFNLVLLSKHINSFNLVLIRNGFPMRDHWSRNSFKHILKIFDRKWCKTVLNSTNRRKLSQNKSPAYAILSLLLRSSNKTWFSMLVNCRLYGNEVIKKTINKLL